MSKIYLVSPRALNRLLHTDIACARTEKGILEIARKILKTKETHFKNLRVNYELHVVSFEYAKIHNNHYRKWTEGVLDLITLNLID